MEIRSIGRNATAFTFDSIENYLTSVFLIECGSKVFLIDTFCGTESMVPVMERLDSNPENKELIIVNTHFHWDHVWGNCSFKGKDIISHVLCRELLDSLWEMQTDKNKKHILGRVEKHLPNITFKEKIIFHNEGIELFHSPGHTEDSISVFDHNERILYAGDNLEKPIIYVEDPDIAAYVNTLESYLNYRPKKIVASHTLDFTEKDIFNTIGYLKELSAGKQMHFESEYEREIHNQNLLMIHKA